MGRRRSLTGARILITGASQGIGRALAVEAARQGMRVLAAARSQQLLQELADEVRGEGHVLETVQADVTSPEDRQHMAEAALRFFGGLDILVNNAGIGATGHFADAEPDRLRKIMEVNFFGLTETTRVLLPILKKGTNPAIVNISSIAGKRGIPARSDYSASKFAVQGFSEALRAELAKDGVDVLVVCPGLTQTNFSQNMLEQKALVPHGPSARHDFGRGGPSHSALHPQGQKRGLPDAQGQAPGAREPFLPAAGRHDHQEKGKILVQGARSQQGVRFAPLTFHVTCGEVVARKSSFAPRKNVFRGEVVI